MSLLNRTELREYLTQGDLEVNFTTALTGQPRKMRCTLRQGIVPSSKTSDVLSKRTPSEPEESGRLSVWDLDKSEWRSFKIENVTYVLIPTPEEDNG